MENSIKKEQSSIEEDIILLKDFTEGNFKRDKLENYKGSYKMGYFYYKDIQQAIEHILSDYKRVLKINKVLLKENERLKEYIMLAPNLDEMTATKYSNIRQDAYIQGRAEEQQKAEQIIYKNYIPIQKVKDKIKSNKEIINKTNDGNLIHALNQENKVLQKLLGENNGNR